MSHLADIALECLQEAAPLIRGSGLTVMEQIGAASGPSERTRIDRALVKQGVAAMLEEAIRRAAPGARLRVTVKTGPQASMIAVKAPGSGIDPSRADEAVPAPASAAAAAHGGRAWANGRPGRGITFYFTLPVAPPSRATAL